MASPLFLAAKENPVSQHSRLSCFRVKPTRWLSYRVNTSLQVMGAIYILQLLTIGNQSLPFMQQSNSTLVQAAPSTSAIPVTHEMRDCPVRRLGEQRNGCSAGRQAPPIQVLKQPENPSLPAINPSGLHLGQRLRTSRRTSRRSNLGLPAGIGRLSLGFCFFWAKPKEGKESLLMAHCLPLEH